MGKRIVIKYMFKKGELKLHKLKKSQKSFVFLAFFCKKMTKKRQYYDTFRDIYDTVTFEGLFLLKLSWNKNIF